ncbi:CU044_5270 family protein [Microbispora triticiradicis]|uniref:Uncharacterized protein n=2 Tax=Microbispora TaxID=2005 RepID=A0ABY3LQD0_9ACTN|nr:MULTISPECIES: CU044_5270 family protein [Microbispora]TLP66538.1 hypothetical protein FED44_03500 [Microbispora fusca]TYB47431.1 hypothetical protein FXF59_29900 [Microbispora tritici]
MNEEFTDVRRLMAPVDPVSPQTFAGAARDPQARATLQRILSSSAAAASTPRSQLSRRRVLAVAGGAVAAASIAGIARMLPGDQPAARIPTVAMLAYQQMKGESLMPGSLPPARSILLKLAEAAEQQPNVTKPADARYTYLQLNEWHLNVAVAGGHVSTSIVPTVTELWTPISATDMVRRVQRPGTPIVTGYGSAETAAAVTGARMSDEEFPPGAVLMSPSPDELPLEAAALRRALLPTERVPADVSEVDQLVEAVLNLYSERNVPPRLAAALWRMLADEPGLRALGDTTDRAGRAGQAIALDLVRGLPKRLVFIIDPKTGHLNSSEEILTKDAGKLNVTIPAVIGYTLFLHRGWTPDNKTAVR